MKVYIMIVCVYVRVFARRKLNFMRSSGGEHPLSGPQRRTHASRRRCPDLKREGGG